MNTSSVLASATATDVEAARACDAVATIRQMVFLALTRIAAASRHTDVGGDWREPKHPVSGINNDTDKAKRIDLAAMSFKHAFLDLIALKSAPLQFRPDPFFMSPVDHDSVEHLIDTLAGTTNFQMKPKKLGKLRDRILGLGCKITEIMLDRYEDTSIDALWVEILRLIAKDEAKWSKVMDDGSSMTGVWLQACVLDAPLPEAEASVAASSDVAVPEEDSGTEVTITITAKSKKAKKAKKAKKK